jgi:hypothetical protein
MVFAVKQGHELIKRNMEMLKPGVHMRDLSLNTHVLDDQYQKGK